MASGFTRKAGSPKDGKTLNSKTHVDWSFAAGGVVPNIPQRDIDRSNTNFEQAKLLKKALGKK